MPDLSVRATDPELLDQGVPDEEALSSLSDLRLVNRWLGGQRSLVGAIRPFLAGSSPGRLLDVGCGSGDLPSLLVRMTEGRLTAVGVDLKVLHLRQTPAEVRRVAADVRRLPFAPQTFDLVTASLFLHHFDAPEVPGILRSLFALARRALVVNDLRRARVPYVFSRAVFPWIFRSRVSVNDGLLSIRRAFTRKELEGAFREAGIPARVYGAFPYRLLAVAERRA